MVEDFVRTISVAATKFLANYGERHSSSRLARERAESAKQATGNISHAGERAGGLPRHWREKDLRRTPRVQAGAVLIGGWKSPIRFEVQRRSEHEGPRAQRAVVVSESRKVQNVARRRQGSEADLSESIADDVVNERDIEQRIRPAGFRFGGQRFEREPLSIATEAAAQTENVRRPSRGRVL